MPEQKVPLIMKQVCSLCEQIVDNRDFERVMHLKEEHGYDETKRSHSRVNGWPEYFWIADTANIHEIMSKISPEEAADLVRRVMREVNKTIIFYAEKGGYEPETYKVPNIVPLIDAARNAIRWRPATK